MSASAAILLAFGAMVSVRGGAAPAASGLRPPGAAEVVYVGNEGFLLVANGRKILIDALFRMEDPELPPPEVRDAIEDGQPPFDDVDLILATHAHVDHFRALSVAACLRKNPRAVFVGPPQTVQQLRDSVSDLGPLETRVRTIGVPPGESAAMDVSGIRIVVMSSGHSGMPDVQNYMYLVEWDGFTAFHEGDTSTRESLAPWGLAEEDIDVAFFHFGRLYRPGGMNLLEETLRARYFVPMHFAYTTAPALAAQVEDMVRDFQNVRYLKHPLEHVLLLEGPYLGQKPPGMTPELFAPGIVSKEGFRPGCSWLRTGPKSSTGNGSPSRTENA
jgi:L-ascorbate metabolism protein UlaG (beta-lactamase superfamily)